MSNNQKNQKKEGGGFNPQQYAQNKLFLEQRRKSGAKPWFEPYEHNAKEAFRRIKEAQKEPDFWEFKSNSEIENDFRSYKWDLTQSKQKINEQIDFFKKEIEDGLTSNMTESHKKRIRDIGDKIIDEVRSNWKKMFFRIGSKSQSSAQVPLPPMPPSMGTARLQVPIPPPAPPSRPLFSARLHVPPSMDNESFPRFFVPPPPPLGKSTLNQKAAEKANAKELTPPKSNDPSAKYGTGSLWGMQAAPLAINPPTPAAIVPPTPASVSYDSHFYRSQGKAKTSGRVDCNGESKVWYHHQEYCACTFEDFGDLINEDIAAGRDPLIRVKACLDARIYERDTKYKGIVDPAHAAEIDRIQRLYNQIDETIKSGKRLRDFAVVVKKDFAHLTGYKLLWAGNDKTLTRKGGRLTRKAIRKQRKQTRRRKAY
jgi:hypothetical protein